MKTEIINLGETASTSDWLHSFPTPPPGCMTVAVATHQTAGRGQGTNRWESEAGKNLLFSILTSPVSVPADRQFVLSMAGALALKEVLDGYCGDIRLKWPNDIYWRDRKISGTLIETAIQGKTIRRCIYGIGLNVNQQVFRSDAPNPVSLYNIIGSATPLHELLDSILRCFATYYQRVAEGAFDSIVGEYNAALYRRDGFHAYQEVSTAELFRARIKHVGTDGLLHLVDTEGRERVYSLKEVKFIIDKEISLFLENNA